MSPDGAARRPLVVKIGGGLLREAGPEGLRLACAEVSAAAARRPVLVVPGGGPFADAVRELDARLDLGDPVAHDLALRAMDQLGVVLGELLPGAAWLEQLTAPRGLSILRAHPAFAAREDVPRSWAVTSDSLAVLAAGAIGAPEAVLLKPIAGVLARWPSHEPPLATLTAAELEALQTEGRAAAVDPYVPQAVRRTGVTVVVRGPARIRPPGGLGAGSPAFGGRTDPSAGTRITPG